MGRLMDQKTRFIKKSALALLLLGATLVVTSATKMPSANAYVKTCREKDKGDWLFGTAASGCNAGDFGDVSRANYLYRSVIFDRTASDVEAERTRYMGNMHAIIRDAASSYFRRREPKASDATVQSWVRAILSIANQETVFSHYRIGKDAGLKLATGDSNHSHGMMQIYLVYHANKGVDNSFDLMGNLMYGMDMFYDGYKKAASTSCGNTFEKAVRGAYSIYNGGGGQQCRYAKARKRNKWFKNDDGYREKYQTRPWTKYVKNPTQAAPVNVNCLIKGDDLCAVSETYTNQPLTDRTLILQDGKMCIFTANKLNCVPNSRMFQCLANFNSKISETRPLKITKPLPYRIAMANDRDALCKQVVPGLMTVGSFLKVTSSVRVRSDVGGAVIGDTKAGQVYQILDYEIRRGQKAQRYYKIALDKKRTGFVFGGDETDFAKWVSASTPLPTTQILIPVVGSTVEVVAPNGVNMRVGPSPDEQIQSNVPKGSTFKVEAVMVRQSTNELFLRISKDGKEGYIYAGQTYPNISVSQWVKVSK